jgi:hypothetical protein
LPSSSKSFVKHISSQSAISDLQELPRELQLKDNLDLSTTSSLSVNQATHSPYPTLSATIGSTSSRQRATIFLPQWILVPFNTVLGSAEAARRSTSPPQPMYYVQPVVTCVTTRRGAAPTLANIHHQRGSFLLILSTGAQMQGRAMGMTRCRVLLCMDAKW